MQPQTRMNGHEAVESWAESQESRAPTVDGSGQPVDVNEVKAAIVRALPEQSALPPYAELCELREVLLGHIEVLKPLAAERINRLNHGTLAWYRKRAKLDSIPYEVCQGLGSGLQSAASHVRSLGYTLLFLVEKSGVLGRGE
ncbi:DUF6415 family natural product biosynthesis protein [Streptomyces natalensis]|uniref:DUF6415 family natural product biosynthesis protein n=1 Tax=Streptomyces natalensis TaxID=68242 RepID=UPI001F51C347|nr:DUF6415 family natural product biosynthesis protein [Streptomyces natalensis]